MTTLADIVKEITVCDEPSLRKIYFKIDVELRKILFKIKECEPLFQKYNIKYHPVSTVTLLVAFDIDSLHRLPKDCNNVKKHAVELRIRLREFKDQVGTPFCNTAHQAYDLLANHVIQPFLKQLKRDLPTMLEISLQFQKLYEELIIEAQRTRPQ